MSDDRNFPQDWAALAPQAEGTRGVVKNRTVEGGKEFWDHVENVATNFQPPKAGAAPAETARPKFGSGGDTAEWEQNKAGSHHAPPLSNEPLPTHSGEMVPQVNSVDSTGNTDNRAEYATSGPGGETAGEMTADAIADHWALGLVDALSELRLAIEKDSPRFREIVRYMKICAESFAKQRVEQAERRNNDQEAIEHAASLLLPLVDTKDGTLVSLAENAANAISELRAKVADLEREHGVDTALIERLDRERYAAESELREMREALARYGNHEVVAGVGCCAIFDGQPCNCGLGPLLARKAGSPD